MIINESRADQDLKIGIGKGLLESYGRYSEKELNDLIYAAVFGDKKAIDELKKAGYKVNPGVDAGTYVVSNGDREVDSDSLSKYSRTWKIKNPAEYLNEFHGEVVQCGWAKVPLDELISHLKNDGWILSTFKKSPRKMKYYIQNIPYNTFEIEKSTFDKLKGYAKKILNEAKDSTPLHISRDKWLGNLYIDKDKKPSKSIKPYGGDGKNYAMFYVPDNKRSDIIKYAKDKGFDKIYWGSDEAYGYGLKGLYNGDTLVVFKDANRLPSGYREDAKKFGEVIDE